MLTQTQLQAHERRKAFHAKIALAARKVHQDADVVCMTNYMRSEPRRVKQAARWLPMVIVEDPLIAIGRKSLETMLSKKDRGYWFRFADIPNTNVVKVPSIKVIQEVVCWHYEVSLMDLISARRTKNLVIPRQIACYLAKEMTKRSLPEIGRMFGGRDHTTVLHAIRKTAKTIEKDQAFKTKIDKIKQEILL